jgi:uncharacterized protein (DUF4213/DUF364 family)
LNLRTRGTPKQAVRRRTVLSDSFLEIRDTLPRIKRIKVANVVIGAGYTGVSLSSGEVGLAYSLLSEYASGCCELMKRAGRLSGSRALELARLALSWDIRSRVVGVATINALSQLSLRNYADRISASKGDVADHLDVRRCVVTVVGNIAPTIRKLRPKAKRLYVLERNPDLRDDDMLPDTAAEEVIPESDVVLITGTSIVNGTVDRLLELSRNSKEVALVGATAGVPPTVLFEHGATAVATIKVKDPERVMRIIAEGGGTPSFADVVEFVIYRPRQRTGEKA